MALTVPFGLGLFGVGKNLSPKGAKPKDGSSGTLFLSSLCAPSPPLLKSCKGGDVSYVSVFFLSATKQNVRVEGERELRVVLRERDFFCLLRFLAIP